MQINFSHTINPGWVGQLTSYAQKHGYKVEYIATADFAQCMAWRASRLEVARNATTEMRGRWSAITRKQYRSIYGEEL